MQYRIYSAFFIFIGSYLPLAVILAVQDIPKDWWARPFCTFSLLQTHSCTFFPFKNLDLAVVSIVIASVSALLSYHLLNSINYPYRIEVTKTKSIPNEIINYTFPYVVSFMGISYNDPEKLLGFIVFLVWMFAITYKSGQIVMNPLLLIFGWRLHEATIIINGVARDVRILKKGLLIPGPQSAQTIQDFYIVKD